MILDSSAIVAIVLREPDCAALTARMRMARSSVSINAATLAECAIVLSARLGRDARGLLARLLQASDVEVVPFTEDHYSAAMDGWLRFGKGRHKAALNVGDCIAYATAILANEPLLCTGDDFSQTDCLIA